MHVASLHFYYVDQAQSFKASFYLNLRKNQIFLHVCMSSREDSVLMQGDVCRDKNYKSSLEDVSVFNTKQFLETQTALISLPSTRAGWICTNSLGRFPRRPYSVCPRSEGKEVSQKTS